MVFFLLLPLIEIAGFVVVGQAIGLLPTLGLTVFSSLAGIVMLQRQGLGILNRLNEREASGEEVGRDIIHGTMVVFAALLLLLPGFVTDFVGLLLFVPYLRELAWSSLRPRFTVYMSSASRQRGAQGSRADADSGTVVDLEEDEFERKNERSSPRKTLGSSEEP